VALAGFVVSSLVLTDVLLLTGMMRYWLKVRVKSLRSSGVFRRPKGPFRKVYIRWIVKGSIRGGVPLLRQDDWLNIEAYRRSGPGRSLLAQLPTRQVYRSLDAPEHFLPFFGAQDRRHLIRFWQFPIPSAALTAHFISFFRGIVPSLRTGGSSSNELLLIERLSGSRFYD